SSLYFHMLTLFFFYEHADHRYLHSFPTRRSSDLANGLNSSVPIVINGKIFERATLIDGIIKMYDSTGKEYVESYIFMMPSINVADRKSTRLNSSHVKISYAVFCLKKKKNKSYIHI